MTNGRLFSVIGEENSNQCVLIDTRPALTSDDLEELKKTTKQNVRVITTLGLHPNLRNTFDTIEKEAIKKDSPNVALLRSSFRELVSDCLAFGWRGRVKYENQAEAAASADYIAKQFQTRWVDKKKVVHFAGEALPSDIQGILVREVTGKKKILDTVEMSPKEALRKYLASIRCGWNGAGKEIR